MKVEHEQLPERMEASRRILVVDDHPSFRSSARALLAAEGYEVVGEAEDGAAALAAVDQLAPELVLLDIQLPDTDGFDVARQLLARDATLRIVLISSRDRSQYGPLIEECGALGFVAKAELSRSALEPLLE